MSDSISTRGGWLPPDLRATCKDIFLADQAKAARAEKGKSKADAGPIPTISFKPNFKPTPAPTIGYKTCTYEQYRSGEVDVPFLKPGLTAPEFAQAINDIFNKYAHPPKDLILPFKDTETIINQPHFHTLRDRDQYYAACAELRTCKAAIEAVTKRIEDAAQETQAMLRDHSDVLSQASQEALVATHATYIEPLLRSIEAYEERAIELRATIEALLGGGK